LLKRHLHLEWIYEEKAETKTEGAVPPLTHSEAVALLPSEERQELFRQAVRGNVKGILTQLDTIERLGDQFLPVVAELRTLTKRFQVDRIVEILEELEKS
jgi:hypothetical protein